ncbi:fibrinogen-like protein 1 [Culex pipiens pallens]|uniref:fibrinogen-like protein 1 n=1 Tax=Culex pipiens pallens TaxID=42434 RepID=UPI001954F0A5|nr:fibrinogen-like protein 1 [Culex pipiens pallens]
MKRKVLVLAILATSLLTVTCARDLEKAVPEDPCQSASSSGVFKIKQLNRDVYCEMNTTFGGGWMVLQQRSYYYDEESFNRSWTEYRAGFGTVGKDTEFWLGLEPIHQLTKSGDYELVVEVKDVNDKNYAFARYSRIHVASESDKYRLAVGDYSGTAGDGLNQEANHMQFTTFDSDNDNYEDNCAKDVWTGGWWFNHCGNSVQNALSPHWNKMGKYYSRMMIHRKL